MKKTHYIQTIQPTKSQALMPLPYLYFPFGKNLSDKPASIKEIIF